MMVVALLALVLSALGETASAASAISPQAAASPSLVSTNEITLDQFLSEVGAANLDYAAQRYNVSIAEAAIASQAHFHPFDHAVWIIAGHDHLRG